MAEDGISAGAQQGEGEMAFREASVETKASPARVWQVWSDVNTWPSWNPDMKESKLDGPLQAGMTGKINTRSGGNHDVVVTQFEAGSSFELESTAMPGTKMGIRATVTPTPNGSRISQAFEARGLLAPVVGPMMGGAILKTFTSVLEALKQKAESGS
jgi:uncharacterized protein YndB with AHSA1/START domain